MSTTIGLQIFLRDGRSIDAVHDSDSILIGSGPSAVLRLDDPNVSSIHAVIKVSPDGHVTVIDLGSEAGTTVNGHAVSEPVTLKVGDQIGVGGARVVVTQLGSAAPKAHVLADTDITAPTTQRPEPKTVAAPPPQAPQPQPQYQPQPKAPAPKPQVQHMHSENKRPLRKEDDIDLSVLQQPLKADNKPSDSEKVLEVVALWGDSVIDSCQVAEPRGITVGPRGAEGFSIF